MAFDSAPFSVLEKATSSSSVPNINRFSMSSSATSDSSGSSFNDDDDDDDDEEDDDDDDSVDENINLFPDAGYASDDASFDSQYTQQSCFCVLKLC
jgi:hypothetical protein